MSTSCFAQGIKVDDSSYDASALTDLLFEDGCVELSNTSYSSSEAVAYFSGIGSDFPIDEGIIIRSGKASYSEGVYTGENLSSQVNDDSDPYLEELNTSGQDASITDVAFMEFDFVPISDQFSFNFIFASNEYGEWQCVSSDVIAFVVTDLTTGEATNIAVIPGSTVPVSVKNIRDQAFNNTCASENENYFDIYNVGNASSSVNMRGYTQVFTASAELIPDNPYHVRLVIGDSNDANYDSAIFLAAGSFNTSVDLGEDQVLCPDESVTLETNIDSNEYEHVWTKDGTVISGETNSVITVDVSGTYEVTITRDGSDCSITDSIVFTDFEFQPPKDITLCYTPTGYVVNFNSTTNFILEGQNHNNFDVHYYTSQPDSNAEVNTIEPDTVYVLPAGFDSEDIWVRINSDTGLECSITYPFEIIENELPAVDSLENVVACGQYELPPLTDGDYYTADGAMLFEGDSIEETDTYYIRSGPNENGCINQTEFTVDLLEQYELPEFFCGIFTVPEPPGGDFYTAIDGPNGTGEIIPPGTDIDTSITLYFYAEIDGVLCRNDAIEIEVAPLPEVSDLPDVYVCGSYTLPTIEHGNYYTKPHGAGTLLETGEVLTETALIYIFADNGLCTNQTIFVVGVFHEPEDISACGSYELPKPPKYVHYFSEPAGMGEEIPQGTVITAPQTIYTYAETYTTPNCTDDFSFDVNFIDSLPVDDLGYHVLQCPDDYYILPELENGEYFTQPDREGQQFFPGDTISAPQYFLINNTEGDCSSETDFTIVYEALPAIESLTDIYVCEPYVLPSAPVGDYYTQPGGMGEELPPGTQISETQTLYLFAATPPSSHCYREQAFTVYVNEVELQDFEDVQACEVYILPTLSIGDYYSEPDEEGIAWVAGDTLAASQEVYVYASAGERFLCATETSFLVEISNTPELPNFPDVEVCGSYTLPELNKENYKANYYFEPNGENKLDASLIEEPGTYTIYVYAEAFNNADCIAEKTFQVTVSPRPELPVEGDKICIDPKTGEVLSSAFLTASPISDDFEIQWFFKGDLVHTGNEYEATETGEYIVKSVKLSPETGADCNYAPTSFNVEKSSRPIAVAKVSEDFADIAIIKVRILQGEGEFSYQLDDGVFQTESEFYDVSSGMHTVTVKDVDASCGETVLQVQVLKYPKFFTPNQDGYNDTWNIPDLRNHREAKVYIHDRFGKLLRVISTSGEGWDGRYHNKALPSNDFWFRVTYEEDGESRQFISHITLKR